MLSIFLGVAAASPVNAQAAPPPAPAAAATAVVNGQVTAGAAAGIGAATVTLSGPANATTQTDGKGNFTFTVPAGEYTITVNKGGYQTASTPIVLTGGSTSAVTVQLTESSLSNLQVIGRTSGSASRNAAKLNISSSAAASLPASLIQDRNVPDLARLVNTLPGITATTNSSTNNSFFRVHGLSQETFVTIDGHPISSGVTGTYLAQFTDSGLVGGVDLLKGAGLNGPTAGESGAGTINIRTPDFAPKDTGYLQGGLDNFGGSFYTAIVDVNVGSKLQFVLGKAFSGYRGSAYGDSVYGIVTGGVGSGANATNPGPRTGPTFTYTTPYLTNNLISYSQDFSDTQQLNSQLAKVRYRFSDATSIGFEYFGLQASVSPEGAAYGQFVGFATIPQCLTRGVAASGAGCTPNSTYNAPFFTSQIGRTNVPLYTFFPGTQITNSNPNFNIDFKTTIGNDTLLLRPYTASITRLIDGSSQNGLYGNGANGTPQGSYEVISPANCQVQFIAPTAAGGAKGPCYLPGSAQGAPAFVTTTTGFATAFSTTTNGAGYSCSLAAPCFTAPTQQSNSGVWGFGTPSSQLEVDKLAGYTFAYVHPVANNIYNFSVDHYYNDTVSFQNDPTALVAPCAFTQLGGNVPSNHNDPGYQPGCALIGAGGTNQAVYKPTQIAIPETFASVTSFSLTAQLQLRPDLEFDFGNYYTYYTINAQQEDPNFIAAFVAKQTAAGDAVNTGIAPIVLSSFTNTAHHYDPHFGFVYRPTRSVVVRATGGSSISIPYASQVSGLESVTQTTNSQTITAPNPSLQPEVIVAEDLGADVRAGTNGPIISIDLFNDVVHNTWLTINNLLSTPPAGFASGGVYYLSTTFNGSGRVSRGVEFGIANLPAVGYGYSLATTFNRLYYVNLPASFLSVASNSYDFAQDYGLPYSKGYLNLQYASKEGSLLRMGIDYEGPGNPANYKSYFQLDAGLRFGLPYGIALQAAVENLTNLNFGANLAHAAAYQGAVPVQQVLVNGQEQYTNTPAPPARGIVAPLPRTFRFSLVKRF